MQSNFGVSSKFRFDIQLQMLESPDQEDINSQLSGLISAKVWVVYDNAINHKFA